MTQEAREAVKNVSIEKLREWLETMDATKSTETHYMEIVIDRKTLQTSSESEKKTESK